MTNEYALHLLSQLQIGASVDAKPIIPQYEFAQALGVAIKALEQENVLEKIRAEILDEAEYAYADFDRYKEDILYAEPDELPDDDFRYGLERAVEIINKYREENNNAEH